MSIHKSNVLKAVIIASAATVLASSATAATKSYVVCNQWNECWRVKEHIATYPSDVQIIYRDDTWWTQHEHDAQWRELPDPSDDHGWYDKDGVWHSFVSAPPQP